MNVTVRNVITSMRFVSMVNWAEFFESVSSVDAVLRNGSGFAAMDFPTRDLYRRAVEDLARRSGLDETDVAKRTIVAAKERASPWHGCDFAARPESDPGYYLIADGRPAFEKELRCRVPLGTRLFRLNSSLGVASYVGMLGLATAIVLALALLAAAHAGAGGWTLLVLAIIGLVPASDVAVAVVNRTLTQSVGATRLPGLELREGIPADLRTIVVVPTLLTNVPAIREQVERLEVHHLSNPDDNFIFALLSDWGDSATEHAARRPGSFSMPRSAESPS